MGNMLVLYIVGIVILLVLGIALLFGLLCYVRFCRLPEKLWCDQVLTQLDQVRQRLSADQQERAQLERRHEAERQGLREKTLHALLQGISVGQLDAYPNIGPATVAKLEAAGYRTLADLHGAHLNHPGL